MAAYLDSLVLTFFFLEIDVNLVMEIFLWILKQSGVIDILRQRTSLKPIFIFPFCQNQASANFWKSRYSYHLKYQYNTLLKYKFSYFMKPKFSYFHSVKRRLISGNLKCCIIRKTFLLSEIFFMFLNLIFFFYKIILKINWYLIFESNESWLKLVTQLYFDKCPQGLICS